MPIAHRRRARRPLAFAAVAALVALSTVAPATPTAEDAAADARAPLTDDAEVARALARGVEILLEREEGEARGEWPYEGVYRVGGRIPIGYRVGGTGICCAAMLLAPGYDGDEARRTAVARGCDFVLGAVDHPAMTPAYPGGYDVRGWGYTYGAWFLLHLRAAGAVPEGRAEAVDAAITAWIRAIERTEIEAGPGGWNYARPGGSMGGRPSSFMTAATIQTLAMARAQGVDVDREVLDRALGSLERSRADSGELVYAGDAGRRLGGVPGAVGRMVIGECTLLRAGRSDLARVRGAIDGFIVHWDWLKRRHQQSGTHVRPYGVAPYYFYFAHLYAAQAVECLPMRERPEYRRRLREIIDRTREDDGSWNDRVFDRSAAYGTAMSMLALMMPEIGPPPVLELEPTEPEPDGGAAAGH